MEIKQVLIGYKILDIRYGDFINKRLKKKVTQKIQSI